MGNVIFRAPPAAGHTPIDCGMFQVAPSVATNNRMVIYPQQHSGHQGIEDYSDFNAEPLHIGIDAVHKLGKTIGSIFKREEAEGTGKDKRP